MSCREFENRAASLTLGELSQVQDQQILNHASDCKKCAAWLQQQRTLAASMQGLRARTADRAAGPNVERVLLEEFRQRDFQPPQPESAYRVTPIAMGLSRFFEIGAYVAVAAAIVVGLFLGVRLLERRSANLPVQGHAATPTVKSPSAGSEGAQVSQRQPAVALSNVSHGRKRSPQAADKSNQSTAESSPSPSGDADYIALMLCDPLSCSSDAQVVRMELPNPGVAASGGEEDAQVRIADVVVGYDGVVRAVRMVN